MSTVYLHSGAKDHIRNCFLLHQQTAPSVSSGLWSSPGQHFVEWCRAVVPRPCEWPARQHGDGLSTLFSVAQIVKKNQDDKSGEHGACHSTVIWRTDKNSLTDNALYGSELSCRRNHAATGIGKIRFTENNIFGKHITKRNRIFHQLLGLVALSASYQILQKRSNPGCKFNIYVNRWYRYIVSSRLAFCSLDALAKLRTATISSDVFACLSVRPHETTRLPPGRIFVKYDKTVFRKSVEKM
jgi:hypothetical protein